MTDLPQDVIPSFRRVVLFPEAVLVLNTNANIIKVDKQTLEMLGWQNEQEFIGKNFSDLIVDQDKENIQNEFQRILSDKNIYGLQCNAKRKNESITASEFHLQN